MIRYYLVLCAVLIAVSAYCRADARADISMRGAMVFVENRGQLVDADGRPRPDILFVAEAPGMKVFLRRTGISYVLTRTEKPERERAKYSVVPVKSAPDVTPNDAGTTVYRMDVEFEGGRAESVVGQEATQEYFNYYYAHCPEGITRVRGHNRVVYRNLYPNIDLVLYTREGGLKYDFVVHPGGDPNAVRLKYEGAEALTLMKSGALQVQTPLGNIEEKRPYTYQGKKEISSRYQVDGNVVKFDVGSYDRTKALIIDPSVAWSTYYGGGSIDVAGEVATNTDGTVIVTGFTMSPDFPVENAIQSSINGAADSFILKFSADGQRLWATFYGGSREDRATGVAIDRSGKIAVSGNTTSTDFPLQNAWHNTPASLFMLQLDANGQRLWSTYFGSVDVNDNGFGIAVDNNDNIVFAGLTFSDQFPLLNAYQTSRSGRSDLFIARFSNTGILLWSTYFGGSHNEGDRTSGSGYGAIAVDRNNNTIVCSQTASDDFPIRNAWQSTRSGGPVTTDCCIFKFNENGELLWSTYYGGQTVDQAFGITTDSKDNILVCGSTVSDDFPIWNAAQPEYAGMTDAFVLKLTPSGQRLWATYHGGSGNDIAYSIDVDGNDQAFITGLTSSTDFPVVDPVQAIYGGVEEDVIICGYNTNGQRIWSTYYGGSSPDHTMYESGYGITVDAMGYVVVVGSINSSNMNMINAVQSAYGGSCDALIAKFQCLEQPVKTVPADTVRFCEGTSVTITTASSYGFYRWSNGATTPSIDVDAPGSYSVIAGTGPCTSASVPVVVEMLPRPAPSIIGPRVLCPGSLAVLQTDKPYHSYRWRRGASTISTEPHVEISQAGSYTLTVTDEYGCTGTSATLVVTIAKRPTTAISLSPAKAEVLCPGDSVVLTALGKHSSYAWSNGATTASITVRQAGVYTVVVADDNGCTSQTVSQTIDAVEVFGGDIRGALSACIGSEEEYSVQSQEEISYTWTATGGEILTDTEKPSVRVRWSQSGTGTLVATSRRQDCSITTTITVSIADSLRPVIIGVPELCGGVPTELRVQGAYATYEWTSGVTSATLVVDTPGTYTVRVSNASGCSGSTTVSVVAGEIPAPLITGAMSVCPGSTVVYTAENVDTGLSFEWAVNGGVVLAGHSTASVSVQWGAGPTGELTVKVTKQGSSCEGEYSLAVVVDGVLSPVLTAVPASPCEGEPVVLSAGSFASYVWSTGETTASITVHTGGEYSVTVSDGNCTGSASVVVTYRESAFGGSEAVVWNNVAVGTTQQLVRTWTNNGSETVRVESWSFVPDLPEFSVGFNPPLPADIPPGGSLEITVQFRPGQPGEYKSELVIESPRPCSQIWRISFDATAKDGGKPITVQVYFPDTTALPWQRGYRIPLLARRISGENGLYTIEFVTRVHASVFYATVLTNGVMTGNTVDVITGERIITGRVENVQFGESETVVTEIVGDVLLGERDNTPLILQEFRVANLPATIEKRDGALVLEGICREGDARFVRSMEGFGITIQPQPVEDELVALVEVVEQGSCSLELYDATGRREIVREWTHGAGSDGAAIVRYNVSAKSAGVYWLVLRTPTQSRTTTFLIVK